jgi:hypothetical protein
LAGELHRHAEMRLALLLATCVTIGCSVDQADRSPTSVALACESDGTTFPALEKACVEATDCFIADHLVSCCGTLIAVGLNTTSQSAFTAAETTCADAYPGCECAEEPTAAEDGRTNLDGAIAVRCDAGLCRTFVP